MAVSTVKRPQVQKQRVREHGPDNESIAARAELQGLKNEGARKKASRLSRDMDELLDEIDLVLEQNAEEFVQNYIQKGGE